MDLKEGAASWSSFMPRRGAGAAFAPGSAAVPSGSLERPGPGAQQAAAPSSLPRSGSPPTSCQRPDRRLPLEHGGLLARASDLERALALEREDDGHRPVLVARNMISLDSRN